MAVGDEMFFPGRSFFSSTSKAPFRHLSPHIAHGLHQAPAPGRLLGQRIFWRQAELSHPPRADMRECPFRFEVRMSQGACRIQGVGILIRCYVHIHHFINTRLNKLAALRSCNLVPLPYSSSRFVGMNGKYSDYSSNAQTYLLICEYIPTSRFCIVMDVCSVYQSSSLIKSRLLDSCSEPLWGDAGCIAGNFRACMGLQRLVQVLARINPIGLA